MRVRKLIHTTVVVASIITAYSLYKAAVNGYLKWSVLHYRAGEALQDNGDADDLDNYSAEEATRRDTEKEKRAEAARVAKSRESALTTARAATSTTTPPTTSTIAPSTSTTSIVTANAHHPYDIWLMNGYLIEDTTIRITLMTKCDYYPNLNLSVDGYPPIAFRTELLEGCPSGWMPKCLYNGYFGEVMNVSTDLVREVLNGKKQMYVGHNDSAASDRKAVKLIDSRVPPDKPKKHKLGVCVFPVIQLAHWGELVQFLEMWIGHGATKFYFVYQSMSKECEAILRIYENDPTIEIERVHWGELQLSNASISLDDNPNGHMIRGEQVFAGSECILRARGHVEYVASVDLDETFVVFTNETLIELIDNLFKKWSNIAVFLFRSSYGVFDNVWINATHPSQLKFDIFDSIYIENRTLGAGSMSKLIVKPERVKAVSVHYALKLENSTFSTHEVDPETGKIFHLRLVKWMYATPNISSADDTLKRWTPGWTERYNKRIADEEKRLQNVASTDIVSLKDKVWSNKGMETMEELEKCSQRLMGHAGESCPAHFKCYSNLTTIRRDEWVYAQQKWVVLN